MNKAIMIALTLAIVVCLVGLEASLLSSKDDREPVCSKYHFEEKVLEKLVRMEHSNSIMMEEFNDIKEKVGEDLAGIKAETEYIKETLKEEKESLKKDRDEFKRSFAEEKGKMAKVTEGEIQKYSDALNELQSQSKTSSYGFSAYWLSDTVLAVGEIPVFSKTIFDESHAYDNSSGKYTVMKDGVYLFTARFCMNSRQYIEANIVADGERFGGFDAGDQDYSGCSSGTAIGKLKKGMKVWMKVTNGATCHNREEPNAFNYFAGLLVN